MIDFIVQKHNKRGGGGTDVIFSVDQDGTDSNPLLITTKIDGVIIPIKFAILLNNGVYIFSELFTNITNFTTYYKAYTKLFDGMPKGVIPIFKLKNESDVGEFSIIYDDTNQIHLLQFAIFIMELNINRIVAGNIHV